MRRFLALAVVTGAALLSSAPASAQSAEPVIDRVISDRRITESSGLAASRVHPGVLWTHNDSGDSARIFAVGQDGATLATYRLAGQQARDWEAMAPGTDGRRPALFIGDIGDNGDARDLGILIHRVVEPGRLRNGSLPFVSYRLKYPDAPHDAEALLVDPRTNRLYIVTKGLLRGAVYAAPAHLSPTSPNILQRIAEAPTLVTDGTFLPDGRIVLRNYSAAYVYSRFGAQPSRIELPPQEQGESITHTADGGELLAGSEGVESAVWRVPLPTVQQTQGREQAQEKKSSDRRSAIFAGAGLVIAGVAAGLCAHVWRKARRRRVAR